MVGTPATRLLLCIVVYFIILQLTDMFIFLFFRRTCEGQNIKYRTCSNVVSSASSSLCNGCQWSFQLFCYLN